MKKRFHLFLYAVLALAGIIGCCLITLSSISLDFYCRYAYQLIEFDGKPYLRTNDLEENHQTYTIDTSRRHWYSLGGDIPEQVSQQPPQYLQTLSKRCDPIRPLTCYRISQNNKIELSLDGGQSWDRFKQPLRIKSKGSCGNPKPSDIIFITEDDAQTSTVVISMGTGGVLMKERENNYWEYWSIENLQFSEQPTSTK